MSSTCAIIPARGGSKGIPGKNLRLIAGRPLLSYAIEAARSAASIERVVVSTDDPAIARTAQQWGAETIERPAEISGDTASSESALLHAIAQLAASGYRPDGIAFLQATSPLTLPEDVDGTVAALAHADSALAVAPSHQFLWGGGAGAEALGLNHDPRHRPRRQDMPPQFVETGAVYAMRTSGFLEARHRFFGRTAFHVIPRERTWEIDEPFDLVVAEMLLRERAREGRLLALPASIGAVVFDFDGVMTDNRVLVAEDGTEAVLCDRADGMGVEMLKQAGVEVLVLSRETNPVVRARCAKLGVACIDATRDKLPVFRAWCEARTMPGAVVYVGNDINDLDCLGAADCGVAVADAHADAARAARIVLERPGGHGAVRELAELILERNRQAND